MVATHPMHPCTARWRRRWRRGETGRRGRSRRRHLGTRRCFTGEGDWDVRCDGGLNKMKTGCCYVDEGLVETSLHHVSSPQPRPSPPTHPITTTPTPTPPPQPSPRTPRPPRSHAPSPLLLSHHPSRFLRYETSASVIANSSAVLEPLTPLLAHVSALVSAGAYLHQYAKHGLEKDEVLDSLAQVEEVAERYRLLRSAK